MLRAATVRVVFLAAPLNREVHFHIVVILIDYAADEGDVSGISRERSWVVQALAIEANLYSILLRKLLRKGRGTTNRECQDRHGNCHQCMELLRVIEAPFIQLQASPPVIPLAMDRRRSAIGGGQAFLTLLPSRLRS